MAQLSRSVVGMGLGVSLLFAGACGNGAMEENDPNGNNGMSGADGGIPGIDPSNTCEQLAINASKGIPNILVVLDRSGSMDDDNRWDQAVPAIEGVTANLQDSVAFGLEMYPSGGGGFGGGSQCSVGSAPSVMPATGMADRISQELNNTGPGGRTPTASALAAAKDALSGLQGSSYVLLVTDGAPNCNSSLDPNTCSCTQSNGGCDAVSCLDDAGSVAAVQALKDAGIPTYVIGFDTEPAWEQVLTNMAAAGGTGQNYFPVTDGSTLQTALANLSGNVVSCSYHLETQPSNAAYVKVSLDGSLVKPMTETTDGSGWELIGSNVELRGSTCDYVKNNPDAKLAIVRECEQVVY